MARFFWFPTLLLGLDVEAGDGVHLSTFSRSEDPWQAAIVSNYVRAKVGLYYDSHPAARIDQEVFPLSAIASDIPDHEGGLARVELAGHLFAPLSGGLGLRSRLWFQTDLYFNEDSFTDPEGTRQELEVGDRFDRYSWRFDHGLSWRREDLHFDLLLHVGQPFIGRQGKPYFSTYVGIQPTATLRLAEAWDLYGGYRFRHEFLRGGGSDYDHHIGFIGSRYRLGEALLMVSFSGGRHFNRFTPLSYWEGGGRLDLFAKLPFQLEGRVKLAYRFRDFDRSRYVFRKDRESHRFETNLTLVKRFGRHLLTEVRWDFGLNRGKRVERYDRHLVGLNVGFEF